MIKVDAALTNFLDVSTKPRRFARSDLIENLGVDHGCLGEKAFSRGRYVFQISVKEQTE